MGDFRVIFAGTPDFAVPALDILVQNGLAPVRVLTQPDRPAGRGRESRPGPVKQRAISLGLNISQPHSLKDESVQNELRELQADLMIVVAYGLILPAAVLEIPRLGCWNIHASLLPRWRGAAPIQRAIEAGDTTTGVCIMQMAEGLDTGPVLRVTRTAIRATETGGSLHDRLAQSGANTLLACINDAMAGRLEKPEPQPEQGVCYATKLSKAEAELDWHESAGQLERRIRAFNPWPVCWTQLGGHRLRVWAGSVIETSTDKPAGSVIAASPEGIDIATGAGVLRLTEIQPAGGKRMPAGAWLNAHPLTSGQ